MKASLDALGLLKTNLFRFQTIVFLSPQAFNPGKNVCFCRKNLGATLGALYCKEMGDPCGLPSCSISPSSMGKTPSSYWKTLCLRVVRVMWMSCEFKWKLVEVRRRLSVCVGGASCCPFDVNYSYWKPKWRSLHGPSSHQPGRQLQLCWAMLPNLTGPNLLKSSNRVLSFPTHDPFVLRFILLVAVQQPSPGPGTIKISIIDQSTVKQINHLDY